MRGRVYFALLLIAPLAGASSWDGASVDDVQDVPDVPVTDPVPDAAPDWVDEMAQEAMERYASNQSISSHLNSTVPPVVDSVQSVAMSWIYSPALDQYDPEKPTKTPFVDLEGPQEENASRPDQPMVIPDDQEQSRLHDGDQARFEAEANGGGAPDADRNLDNNQDPTPTSGQSNAPLALVEAPAQPWSPPVVIMAALGGILILGWPLVHILSTIKHGLRVGLHSAWAMFTRINRHAVLKNNNRQAIMNYVENNPGATIRSISDGLHLARSTVRHHVQRLREHKMANCVTQFNECRVFPVDRTGRPALDETQIVLMRPQEQNVARFLNQNPGAFQRAISRKMGLHPSRVHVILGRLSSLGLIQSREAGRRTYYYPTDRLAEAV